MAEIFLNGGHTMVIDEQDVPLATAFRWQVSVGGYAHRIAQAKGRRRHLAFHRLVIGAKRGEEIDHINGDRLDNRRSNLRVVTRSQNQQNRRKLRSATGVRGVERRQSGRFRVRIWLNGNAKPIGIFYSLAAAEKAAIQARRTFMTHAPECEAQA